MATHLIGRSITTSILASLIASVVMAAETPLSSIFYTGAPSVQEQPQATSDGTNFLVAWRDYRFQSTPVRICAVLLSSDGSLINYPGPIPIPDPQDKPPTSWTNAPPSVVWAGSVYLIAWLDAQSSSMRIVRLDRDGRVLDAQPRVISNVGSLMAGAAASTGNRAMIVYVGLDLIPNRPSVHAALFDADGNVTRSDIALPHAQVDDMPMIASNGQSFYVAWRRWDGVRSFVMGASVTVDGTPGDARAIATTFTGPMIASNGKDYLVAYIDAQKRLTVEHVDTENVSISQVSLPYSVGWPFVGNLISRYGNGYVLAAVGGQRQAIGVVLDRDGQRVSETQLTASGTVDGTVAFAANASATLVAWPELRFADRDIFARVIGRSSDDTLASPAAAAQQYPRVASSGSGYLSVWLENRGATDAEVRGRRLARTGTPIDADSFKIADHAWTSTPPSVTFDGRNFVAAWFERRSINTVAIRINRITPDGVLLDGTDGRVAVEAYPESFAIASNGRESLLVWAGWGNSYSYLRAARISRDGTTDSAPLDIPTNQHAAVETAVSGSGNSWLITWSEVVPIASWPYGPPPPPPKYNILAARVSAEFNLLDAVPLVVASTELVEERHPSVASSGDDFLVAWDESTGSVHARTITSDAVMSESVEVASGLLPAVSWLGDDYAIAWQHSGDLFLARFNQYKSVQPLASSSDDESHVAIAASANHGAVAVYERIATEAIYGTVSRAFRQVIPISVRRRVVQH